ncbi:MAG TPA: FAD-containing oxidoreductase [Polyangiaceae bacterium]|jgi:pyruvate/2-oxoglutarate dehydrogenase complex dihydrolipoamide dehydrogenase (E3) component
MKVKRFNAIVIGTGQAGPPLAARLATAGQNVAIVERKLFGGTCVNTGCVPTKTLVASARAAAVARRAADYGVLLSGPVGFDLRRAKARADAASLASRRGVESSLRENPRCTVLQGHARFVARDAVQVGDDTLEAKRIFIDVGGRARVAIRGAAEVPHLTNASMLALESLPRHLVIIGGGPVGLEFAQMYRRFGSEVTVVEMRSRLLDHEDEDVSIEVQRTLEGEGVRVRLAAECISLAPARDGVAVSLDCGAGDPTVTGSHVLLAIGRKPNTDDLGLEHAGVKVDGRGYVVVDDVLRTSAPGIWALGECNGHGAFTHTAYDDYEIVAANLLDGEPRKLSDRIEAYAVYMDPPLGRAGLSADAARKTGRAHLVGERRMTRVARAVEKGETQGFMRAIVDAETSKIVGATILGTGGDEAIHALLYAMYAGATAKTLTHSVGIHPTVSELLPTILGELRPLV